MADHNEIPSSGLGATARASDFSNLGDDRSQSPREINTKERMQNAYGLNEDIFNSYLNDIENQQQEWTQHQVDLKGNETSRGKKIAGTIAEMVVPIAAGTAADNILDAAGMAGGPLVSAVVGAVSGGARAAMEYKYVGKEGENAAEFWQKNVGSKDKKTEEGNFLKRGWAHISRVLKGGSYLGIEVGFKVKNRDEEIKSFMNSTGIQINESGEVLNDANLVFTKLEQSYLQNPQDYEKFVKNLMTQSVLSNFSEQKTVVEQKQTADLFCISNAVLYKIDSERVTNIPNTQPINTLMIGAPSPTTTIDKLWNETRTEVKEIISKTKGYFIAGAATERAIKSTLGFFAVKWITNGIERVGELKAAKLGNAQDMENTNTLLGNTNNNINSTNQDITSLKSQIDSIDLSPETTIDQLDYETMLTPAAKASGQNINDYLSIVERSKRITNLPDIAQSLSNQDTANTLVQLSEKLGTTPEKIVESGMLRWVYDSEKYSDIGGLFESALDTDGPALWSIQQALEASKNVHPAWEDLAKALLDNPVSETGGNGVELLQQLQDQLLDKQDYLNLLINKKSSIENLFNLQNAETSILSQEIKKSIWDASKRGVAGVGIGLADLFASTEKTDFMYGEKQRNNQAVPNTGIQPINQQPQSDPVVGQATDDTGQAADATDDTGQATDTTDDTDQATNTAESTNQTTNEAESTDQRTDEEKRAETWNEPDDPYWGFTNTSSYIINGRDYGPDAYKFLDFYKNLPDEYKDILNKGSLDDPLLGREVEGLRELKERNFRNWNNSLYVLLQRNIHPDTNGNTKGSSKYFNILNNFNAL